MAEADCLGEMEEIIISKLEAAYQSGALDCTPLSESLGREREQ